MKETLQSQATSDKEAAFLASFVFPEVDVREQQIESRHPDTCEWIFEPPTSSQSWSSFADWLRAPDPMYWVCGKAGSGKSTAMKFMSTDERTEQNLHAVTIPGSPDHWIIVFFFWKAGHPMQKSARGLLQSLIYQLLKATPSLLTTLLNDYPHLSSVTFPTEWSIPDLEWMLDALFKNGFKTGHRVPGWYG